MTSVNRSQGLVLAFFAVVVVALGGILAFAPDAYANVLHPLGGSSTALEIALFAALVALVTLLSVGIIRRSRWMFWLVVVAFLAGLLRVPAAVLELLHVLPGAGPAWFEVFQGVVGAVQVGIAAALIMGYRKAGVWGAF
jgi:hypothetical protein